MFFSQHPSYTCHRMSSTWVIHFLAFLTLLVFAKSNSGAGCEGFYPKVGSIPASRTSHRFDAIKFD